MLGSFFPTCACLACEVSRLRHDVAFSMFGWVWGTQMPFQERIGLCRARFRLHGCSARLRGTMDPHGHSPRPDAIHWCPGCRVHCGFLHGANGHLPFFGGMVVVLEWPFSRASRGLLACWRRPGRTPLFRQQRIQFFYSGFSPDVILARVGQWWRHGVAVGFRWNLARCHAL